MHKFFVSSCNFCGNTVNIEGEDVKHISKVLRMKPLDKIFINNCEGQEFLGQIESIDKKNVIVKIIEHLDVNNESNINIHLYQGLPKSTKMDFIVQKTCELGISSINPVIMERVVVKSEIAQFEKTDRWQKIALEACKQCKRSIIPAINKPVLFTDMLNKLKHMDIIIVPYENEKGLGIKDLKNKLKDMKEKEIAIVVGPEGGFSESEIDLLKENKAHIVTLGSRILRCETAAITSCAIVQYEFGDLGGVKL